MSNPKPSPLTVSVRLTESEMALLRTYSALAECNITDVCRSLVRRLLPDLEELVAELEKRNRVITYANRFLPTAPTDNGFAPQLNSDADETEEETTLSLPLDTVNPVPTVAVAV